MRAAARSDCGARGERGAGETVGHNRGMSPRSRPLLLAGIALVVVALLTAAGWAWWRWDGARRPVVDDALPAMDGAMLATLRAAGDEPVVAVGGVVRSAVCDLGPLRTGGRFTRSADLYVPVGAEDALIGRVAAGLPPGYRAQRGAAVGTNAAPLTATVATQAELSVRQLGPGWIIARVRTGCSRGQPPAADTVDVAGVPGADRLSRVLTALGTRAAETRQNRLGCPGGLRTVAVVSQRANADDLAIRLATVVPPGADRFRSPSNRVSFRDGATSVTVSASDDNTAVTITSTGGC